MPQKKKPRKKQLKQRNQPLRIPLSFDQIVDGMLQTKPIKKTGQRKLKKSV